MANSLFNQLNGVNNNDLKSLLDMAKKNPNEVFNSMMMSNPKFASFVNANKGKSAEQIAKDYGVDLNALKSIIKF